MKNEKKIPIILIVLSVAFEATSQHMRKNVDCDTLVKLAQKQFGCGQAWIMQCNLLKRAAECYKENNEIDKAISLAESNVYDINEQYLGSQGWIEKMVEFHKIKSGKRYVKSQLKEAKVKIEFEELYMQLDSLTLSKSHWDDIFWITVEVFGKRFAIRSTIKSKAEDERIYVDLLMSKITKEEINGYFYNRWKESLLYIEMEK